MTLSRNIRRLRGLQGVTLFATVSALTVGCGSGDDGPPGDYRQVFEKPAGDAPAPKVVPEKKGPRDSNDLSPRERREQAKGK